MKIIISISLLSLFLALSSCGNNDNKRFEQLIKEAVELESRMSDSDNTTEKSKRLMEICKEIVSLDIDENQKGNSYYFLAWHDSETGQPIATPDYSYLEKSAGCGNPIAVSELARKYLNERQNDKAYQLIQSVDDSMVEFIDNDVLGVLYYEGASGLPKDVNKACDKLATGTENSSADVDEDCLYPDFEKRKQLYAGHLNLIKYIDKKRIQCGHANYFIPDPQGPEFSALRAACRHYKSALKLGADFPMLDEMIRTLSTFVDTYDYYKENGEMNGGDKIFYLAKNGTEWRFNGIRTLSQPNGIYLDDKYLRSYDVDSTGYLIRDWKDPSIKALEVERFDDHFEIFIGEMGIEIPYGFGNASGVRKIYKSGYRFNSNGDINPV